MINVMPDLPAVQITTVGLFLVSDYCKIVFICLMLWGKGQ